jgi:hypothetical protein
MSLKIQNQNFTAVRFAALSNKNTIAVPVIALSHEIIYWSYSLENKGAAADLTRLYVSHAVIFVP